jgi:hypothetical protein
MIADTTKNTLEMALRLWNEGWCVIPLSDYKKRPLAPWKKFQNRRPTRYRLSKWFPIYKGFYADPNDRSKNSLSYRGKPAYIGLLCGSISGGRICLDIDDINDYIDYYEHYFQRYGHSLTEDTMVERTLGKHHGFHVFFRVGEAYYAPIKRQKIGPIELKAEKSYVQFYHNVLGTWEIKYVKRMEEILPPWFNGTLKHEKRDVNVT